MSHGHAPAPSVSDAPAGALTGADVARFRDAALALLPERPSPGRPLALAVSGGADSMAMLALAAGAFPGAVIAATVDHRLRAESADEAAMVARWCSAAAVPHRTLPIESDLAAGNLQAQARAWRYALLGRWARHHGAPAVATAHHADDQAETFLMRAARGSGIAGLAGVRAQQVIHGTIGGFRDETRVIRPLLGWRRAALRALAEAARLPFVDDPSNVDPKFDRVAMRRLLATTDLLDGAHLAAAAAHAAEADAALDEAATLVWRMRASATAEGWRIDVTGLPRELQRRLARRAIADLRRRHAIDEGRWSDASNVEALIEAMNDGRGATQAGVMATPDATSWLFRKAPPRRSV